MFVKKIFIEFDVKNTKIDLIYSQNYGTIHRNNLRMCLNCIKTDNAMRKESGRRNASQDVLFLSLFLSGFWKKVIRKDRLVTLRFTVQNK